MNGPSNLGRALNKVMKYAFTPARVSSWDKKQNNSEKFQFIKHYILKGDRPDVENIVVLVTDGLSEDKVQLPLTVKRKHFNSPLK